MQKHILLKTVLLVTVLFAETHFASAQTKVLDSMIVISTGEYRPTIADANKINSNPSVNDSTKKIPVSAYGISAKKINTGFDVEPITAAQMVGEPLTKLYNGLIKIGFGNYTTPYGEVWYNSLRSKDYAYGIRMKHLSSSAKLQDYGYSGFSDNEISLNGKKFLKEHTLLGNFDYVRNVVHFYGYDASANSLDKDVTVQRFNLFSAKAELMSHYTKADRYSHDIKLSYYNLADLYKASENNLKANGYVQRAINKELLKVNASVDYYNYKTSKDTTNNTIITLNPNFIASGEKYQASIGVTGVMDVFVKSKFYFYPTIDLSYNIFENIIIPYVGAKGGLQKNSFKSITDENPFVSSRLEMQNSNHKYELFGGVKGTISSNIAYNARASYTDIENMTMYFTDRNDLLLNRFYVGYSDATVFNVHGEVTYQDREKLRVNLYGDYYRYDTKFYTVAYYKPQVKIGASANYNLKDKIIAKVDLFYIDKQFARVINDDNTGTHFENKELKAVFDANLGVEYRFTKKLGFFLNFNNIAAMRYTRWINYPTQKFSVMGGLSFSF